MTPTDVEPQEKLYDKFSIFHLSLFVLFSFELLSGVFLSFYYRSSSPYLTDSQLHSGLSKYVQSFHYWSSSFLILGSFFLVLTDLWTGSYGKSSRFTFTATAFAFLTSLAFQMTGNLLPFDRHGVQTATIEAGIGARLPIGGTAFRSLILGGPDFSPHTVELWYTFHLILTVGAFLVFFFAWLGRSNLGRPVPLRPALLTALVPLLLSSIVASPLGTQAAARDFDAFADRASWYTLPLHGSLILTSKINPSLGWIGAILIPSLAACALFITPWVFPNVRRAYVRSASVVAVLYFGIAGALYGGQSDRLTGTRDPATINTTVVKSSAPIDKALAAAGERLFNTSAVGCSSCHGADGISGGAGPSLKNAFRTHPDSDFYIRYIKNPQSLDPNSTMPAFPNLSTTQLRQIAEYVRSAK